MNSAPPAANSAAEAEMPLDERFRFGKNWAKFLSVLDDNRIAIAEDSLKTWLGVSDLKGRRFLDIGCGSGLFSLCARRLGATVRSFDFDPDSVGCAMELRRRYFPNDSNWEIHQGSVLDPELMESLGQWDIVYSWGVLHHTGRMWEALENAGKRVQDNGTLFIAIYNDQGGASRRWTRVKSAYCASPKFLKWVILFFYMIRLWGPVLLVGLLKGRPFDFWTKYRSARGMSPWHDLVDWVGGYPFEVAKPEEIFNFFRDRGFRLLQLKTCGGGLGCNEFVFRRDLK